MVATFLVQATNTYLMYSETEKPTFDKTKSRKQYCANIGNSKREKYKIE